MRIITLGWGVIDLSFTPLHSSGSTFTKKIHVVAKTRVLSNFTLKVSFFFIEMCLGVRSLKNNEYLLVPPPGVVKRSGYVGQRTAVYGTDAPKIQGSTTLFEFCVAWPW